MRRWDEGRRVEVVLDGDDVEPAEPGWTDGRERPDGPDASDGPDRSDGPDGPDGPDAASAPATAGRPGARDHRRWRRTAGALLIVLLAVLAVLAAVDVRADRRERAALAAYADVPGVLGSLAEPLGQAWRLPVFPPLAAVGGVVVTADEPDVVGLDLATGERRWTLSRPVGSARPLCPWSVPGGGGGDGGDGDGDAVRLLCESLEQGVSPFEGTGMTVLDTATGEVGPRLGVDGFVATYAVVDGGVVTLGTDATGRRRATLLDVGVDRGERWSVALERPGGGLGEVRVHGDRQVVAVEGPTTVVLDTGDGRELGRWVAYSDGVAPAVAGVVSHPGAGFGMWESRFSGRWYEPDGTPGARLDGEPVEAEIDDGSAPEVLLLGAAVDDRLRAVHVGSGEEIWDRPAPDRVLLRLGGRTVVTADGRLEAWDVATGAVEWSVELEPGEVPNLGGPYTDGVRILVRGEDDDGTRLTAYRLADGERVWSAPLPAGTEYVAVLGDRLAAVGRLDGGRTQGASVLG